MISDELFKTALAEAETKLDQLLTEEAAIEQRHSEIDIEIAKITDKIGHLAALSAPQSGFRARFMRNNRELGITTAVENVLKAAEGSLTVSEVKDRLKHFGFDPNNYKNLMATLHVVLDRMKKSEQVFGETNPRGRKVYQWNPNYSLLRFDRRLLEETIRLHPRQRTRQK